MQSRIYDIQTWREAVDHLIFVDADGYAIGLDGQYNIVDEYIKPSDIDVLDKNIHFIKWISGEE